MKGKHERLGGKTDIDTSNYGYGEEKLKIFTNGRKMSVLGQNKTVLLRFFCHS